MTVTGPVLLYDGLCGFCDWAVQFIIRREKRGVIRFAALQGEYAAEIFTKHPWLREIDSLILVEPGDRISIRSDGALRVAAYLGGLWHWTSLFRIVPRFIRDWAYDRFAKHRYRVFGRYDACPLPSLDQRRRFLP